MKPALWVIVLALAACARPRPTESDAQGSADLTQARAPAEPLHMEELEIPGDLPAWALRGARAHDRRFLFVPGMCVHPLGYAQAFQWAAGARGDLVTLQGDVPCGGAFRRWSGDLDTMKRRIDAVFAAAGLEERDVTVIGYSQGAERAERLAARWPDTFTRVVLIASPVVPSAEHLRHVRAAVLMAGTLDRRANMELGLKALGAAKVPATFIPLPNARHGQMGDDPEATFRSVFEWLDIHSPNRSPAKEDGGPAER